MVGTQHSLLKILWGIVSGIEIKPTSDQDAITKSEKYGAPSQWVWNFVSYRIEPMVKHLKNVKGA